MARIVVGITGGIAAYKAVALVRELLARGHEVRVVMTEAATRFVGPITLAGITGRAPVVDLWDPAYGGEVHVELAGWAEAIVVAPATANSLARLASGGGDDALAATLLCFAGPVLLAPAMHHRMWEHPATRRNVAQLEADGARCAGPVDGPLASGESGMGRMAEPPAIAAALEGLLAPRDLAGRRVLVTAGGTVEDLDPVRALTNASTGKMGYALAERAHARGARVTLVTAPTHLTPPAGVEVVRVRSALDMEAALTARRGDVDAIVMAAAVADYRPRARAAQKIKKGDGETLTLELERNPDLLAGLGAWRTGRLPLLVGFALETERLVEAAREKLAKKRVDLIVANEASASLGREDNRVVLVDAQGEEALPTMDKRAVADRVLDRVVAALAG